MPSITRWMGEEPGSLRQYLQDASGEEIALRRAVLAVSLVGIAAMACTTLLQTGVVKRLTELPVEGFDTKKVNSSDEAYSYGGPDSPIAIVGHGLNMVLASTGGRDRARRQPWLPLLAALVASVQGGVAAKYLFYQMPKVDKAWCPYCIVDALTHFATFALALPEAARAARHVLAGARG